MRAMLAAKTDGLMKCDRTGVDREIKRSGPCDLPAAVCGRKPPGRFDPARHWLFCIAVAIVLSLMGVCGLNAAENLGAEQMVLDCGNGGPVPFPHHRHQVVVGDCQVCHVLFPQEEGSINKLKAGGQLARKQVMNKLCVQCHKERQRTGQNSGPTTCTECHRK